MHYRDRYCHKQNLRFLILGRGSNCIFDDRGFDGCVMLNQINFVDKINPVTYWVGSDYAFNLLGLQKASMIHTRRIWSFRVKESIIHILKYIQKIEFRF